jgi:hypothetical protein
MKRYIEHIKNTRTTHERRQHAMQVSGLITGTLFAVWLGTLGYRLTAQTTLAESPDTSLTAAAAASTENKGPQLEVSTTSVFQ